MDVSQMHLRRLMKRLRDISKRADLQISETSPARSIKDASSETSMRSLGSSQRRLWVASEAVILCFQTEAFLGTFWSTEVSFYWSLKNLSELFIWEKSLLYSIFLKILIFSYTLLSVRRPSRKTSGKEKIPFKRYHKKCH